MNEDRPFGHELKETSLLAGLSDEGRQQVLDAMVVREFDPGEVILRQGIVTQNVWLLLEGRCEVVKEPPLGELGKAVTLAELVPYETFGEMTMFMEKPHTASVCASADVKTIKLRRADFERLTADHPATASRLVCNLVNILSERLRRMDDWITELLDEREAAVVQEQWTELRERLQQTFQGQIF
jgi:CRP-like cAMP-binding protein